VVSASSPRPSPLRSTRDGLADQGGPPWGDVEPAPDLGQDLGGIPPCPGRVVQPAGVAVGAGLGQVGGQAVRAAVDDGPDDVMDGGLRRRPIALMCGERETPSRNSASREGRGDEMKKAAAPSPRPHVSAEGSSSVAKEPAQGRGSAAPKARKSVMASVRLDVATHARVSAAAALAGMDKSAWMARAIRDALKDVVVIDRRKSPDGAKSPDEVIDSDPSGD
jgi:hypothetical protein